MELHTHTHPLLLGWHSLTHLASCDIQPLLCTSPCLHLVSIPYSALLPTIRIRSAVRTSYIPSDKRLLDHLLTVEVWYVQKSDLLIVHHSHQYTLTTLSGMVACILRLQSWNPSLVDSNGIILSSIAKVSLSQGCFCLMGLFQSDCGTCPHSEVPLTL